MTRESNTIPKLIQPIFICQNEQLILFIYYQNMEKKITIIQQNNNTYLLKVITLQPLNYM